jgi:hypothetical protein
MPYPTNRLFRRLAPLVATIVVTAPACAPPPPPGRVYVFRRPPPERVEVITVRPGPGYVRAQGYWRWERDAYAWVPGRWVAPERGYNRWVPGHWAHDRRGWYWIDGRWR